jgi:uncharacterized membrane protein YgaE (UPF0421/DUF939 family)
MMTSERWWRGEAVSAWPLLQGSAAATAAWLIAALVVRHHQPFFAPIATVVALNTTIGERGTNALRLLLGVVIGIAIGELTIALLGGGYGRMALAMFVAMLIARHLDGARIVIAQAAAGAILTVAVANGEAGTDRLGDALIGGGVALLFSQILFTPEPVGLMRRASVAAFQQMARALTLASRGLERDDESMSEAAFDSLRELRERLADLQRMMRAGKRVVRHSLYWRSRADAVAREVESARHVELLGGSLIMLVRSALASDASGHRSLIPVIHELGEVFAAFAAAPGDLAARRRAADRAVEVARGIGANERRHLSAITTATFTAELVASDLIALLDAQAVASSQPRIHPSVPSPPARPGAPDR